MKKLILTTTFFFSFTSLSFAQSQSEVSSMLDQFQKEGILNADQVKQAKDKMKNMDASQWQQIQKLAAEKAASGDIPNIETENSVGSAAAQIDTDSAEFKDVMNKVKGIMQQQQ